MAHDYTERLYDTDLVGKLQPYVNSRQIGYEFVGDDWLRMHETKETNTPWLVHKRCKGQLCHIFHTTYLGVFGVIPQYCFKHCWKIAACNKGMTKDTIRQLTMKEIMEIEEAQQYLDMPSKCGMDRRDYTPNTWGSFWYFNSLDEARRNFNKIRGTLDLIDPDIDLIIKRSCTEFELYLGPSDTWDDLELDWMERESVLDGWILREDREPTYQHELIKRNVRNRMLQWAHKHGDFTYKQFNRGDDLIFSFPAEKRVPIIPSVTYKPQ